MMKGGGGVEWRGGGAVSKCFVGDRISDKIAQGFTRDECQISHRKRGQFTPQSRIDFQ